MAVERTLIAEGENMAEENTTPENQDTSEEQTQEKLFFGKYKSQEEAEAAFKEMERAATEAKEALDREQRLNALLSTEDRSQPQEQQAVPQYQGLQGVFDEEQAAAVSQMLQQEREMIVKQMRAEGRQMWEEYKVRTDAERQFYEEYKDLAHFKEDVDAEANRLALELGHRASRVPMKDLMKEVAKRTRDKLATQKSKLTKSHLHLESGEVVEPEVKFGDAKPKQTSEDERTQKFFAEEVGDFNKRKYQPLRG